LIIPAIGAALALDLAVYVFLASFLRLSTSQVFRMKEAEESNRERLAGFIEKRDLYVPGFFVTAVLATSATQILFAAAGMNGGLVMPWLAGGLSSTALACVASVIFSARAPEKKFLALLPFMQFLSLVLFPLTFPVYVVGRALKTSEPEGDETREEEIEAFLDEGQREGIIEKEESELIRGIMEFSDTVVREVMTPRIDVVSIESSATLEEALKLFAKCRHTRVPVFENHIDNIVGVIWVKDILAAALSKERERKVREFVRPVSFVPENKAISDLLKEFQSKREQLAIIVDEYGGVDGLVTTEDLVEEIVGEIEERGESEGKFVKPMGGGVFEAKGRASLYDLSEAMGVELPEGDYDSVAGWIATGLGTIPAAGQSFELDGLQVEILSADRKRIHRVKVSKASPPEGNGGKAGQD
jgi:CBS domain containing-hemolysin-like protein